MRFYINLAINYIKSYKARSLAIALSIILSVILIVGVGSLSYSAKKVEIDIIKYDTGSSHVSMSEINSQQLQLIKNTKGINKVAVTSFYDSYNYKNKVLMNLVFANQEYLQIQNSQIKKGRFPTNLNEIALEEWVIENLDLQPIIDQKLNIRLNDKDTQQFKLVGIIKDIPHNKSAGKAEGIIGGLNNNIKSNSTVYLEFNEKADILNTTRSIQQKAKIKDDNISINTMLLNAISKLGNIDWNLIILTIFITIVCGIVIYSIFNISTYQRMGQYGILRAIGGEKWQIFYMTLTELGIISLFSIPIGMVIGVVGAQELSSVFGKLFTEFEVNSMQILISKDVLLFSIFVIFTMIIIISLKTSRDIIKISPIQAIKQNLSEKENKIKKQNISVSNLSRFIPFHIAISFKNITRNKKSFVTIILSMVLGSVLFLSSNYYATLQEILSQQNLKRNMVNYDYKMVTNGTLNMNKGLSHKDIDDIKKIKGIEDVTPTKVTYSRAIIDKRDILSKEYFDYLEQSSSDWDTRVKESKDKSSLIIQNNIWGYTDQGLNELKKSVITGRIDTNMMKKDKLAVVYVPTNFQMGDKKVVDINPGDTIRVTFRKDGVISKEFYDMKDTGEYIEKEFIVAAVITNLPVWDDYYSVQNGVDVIIPEKVFNKVIGFDNYRIVHANNNPTVTNPNIYKELLSIASRLEGITVRDLSKERVQVTEYYNIKDSFVYVISIVLFIISMFNITNNVSYSLVSRTNEFGMMRAVGLTNNEFKQMVRFEGLSYAIIASICSIIFGLICQGLMFRFYSLIIDQLQFEVQWLSYLLVILINLGIGLISTYFPARKIKDLSIIGSISAIE